jgi:hypothetical protein
MRIQRKPFDTCQMYLWPTFLGLLLSSPLAPQRQPDHQTVEERAVRVQMRNVMYHFRDDVAVHIRRLGGELAPSDDHLMPVFDDKESFTLHIAAAEVAIRADSLARILNDNVFSREDSPVKDVSITIDNDRLRIKGKLHGKGDLGFSAEGRLSATEDGKIRLHVEKIQALHLPLKGLMDLLGVDIADVIKNGKVAGLKPEKDDLILDLAQVMPPPRLWGKITQVRLEPDSIVPIFGDPLHYPWEAISARNYMAYHGNRLQFGKLIMNDTDLILIDSHPEDPFDFYLDHYKEQLTAGWVKTTPQFGLRVFMVDRNKLKHRPAGAGPTRAAGPVR